MSPSGATLSSLGYYLLISLLFVFSTMLEFAFVLALRQIQKMETFYNTNLIIEMKSNGMAKQTAMNRDIIKIRPKLGEDQQSQFKTDQEIVKFGCRERLLGMFRSMPLTAKIDLFSFSIFNLMYFIMNCIYWVNFL